MEEQKNNQELQEETLQAPVTEEEIPGAEVVAEEPTAAAEETVEQTPVEPVKKATPGKIAVAVGIVILLAALLIALVAAITHGKAPAKSDFSCEGCPSAGHCHTAECHKKGEEV